MNNKTIVKIKEAKYASDKDIRLAVKYIVGEKDGKCVPYWNAFGCRKKYPECADNIIGMQKRLGKTNGPRIKHIIISFDSGFSEENDLYAFCRIADNIALYFFRRFQVIYAVHDDTDKTHFHFIINAVSYGDGRKWHLKNGELQKLKEKICRIAERSLAPW